MMQFASFEMGYEPTWVRCADCGVETARHRCYRCESKREDEREAHAALARCNFPPLFDKAIAGTRWLADRVHHPKLSLDAIQERVRRSGTHLVIAGTTGMGKTCLGVAMLRERAPRCLFAAASILGAFGPEGDELRARAARAHTLLIDDLGKDADTSNQYLVGLIDRRHNDALPTWITTGLTMGQIKDRYDESFLRRTVTEATRIMLEGPAVISHEVT